MCSIVIMSAAGEALESDFVWICFKFQSIAATPFSVAGQVAAGGLVGATAVTPNAAGKVVSTMAATSMTGIRVLSPSMVPTSAIRVASTVSRQPSN